MPPKKLSNAGATPGEVVAAHNTIEQAASTLGRANDTLKANLASLEERAEQAESELQIAQQTFEKTLKAQEEKHAARVKDLEARLRVFEDAQNAALMALSGRR